MSLFAKAIWHLMKADKIVIIILAIIRRQREGNINFKVSTAPVM
jgi:hypothetical protein